MFQEIKIQARKQILRHTYFSFSTHVCDKIRCIWDLFDENWNIKKMELENQPSEKYNRYLGFVQKTLEYLASQKRF